MLAYFAFITNWGFIVCGIPACDAIAIHTTGTKTIAQTQPGEVTLGI